MWRHKLSYTNTPTQSANPTSAKPRRPPLLSGSLLDPQSTNHESLTPLTPALPPSLATAPCGRAYDWCLVSFSGASVRPCSLQRGVRRPTTPAPLSFTPSPLEYVRVRFVKPLCCFGKGTSLRHEPSTNRIKLCGRWQCDPSACDNAPFAGCGLSLSAALQLS